jgi:hypothetical protein
LEVFAIFKGDEVTPVAVLRFLLKANAEERAGVDKNACFSCYIS